MASIVPNSFTNTVVDLQVKSGSPNTLSTGPELPMLTELLVYLHSLGSVLMAYHWHQKEETSIFGDQVYLVFKTHSDRSNFVRDWDGWSEGFFLKGSYTLQDEPYLPRMILHYLQCEVERIPAVVRSGGSNVAPRFKGYAFFSKGPTKTGVLSFNASFQKQFAFLKDACIDDGISELDLEGNNRLLQSECVDYTKRVAEAKAQLDCYERLSRKLHKTETDGGAVLSRK